jgi:hypothetical protein
VKRIGLLLIASLASLCLTASTANAAFGFRSGDEGFAVSALAPDAQGAPGVPVPATQAGAHPYQFSFHVGLNEAGGYPDGDLRGLTVEFPPGFMLNPSAVPACAPVIFNTPRSSPFEASRSGESCPEDTQVGTVEVDTNADGGEPRRFGVFNITAPNGTAMRLGFSPFGAPIVLDARLRPEAGGRYSVVLSAADVPQSIDVEGLDLTLWGAPWAVSHNGERGNCLNQVEPDFPWAKCSIGNPITFPPKAFVTMPVECSPSLPFTATATSWQGGGPVVRGAVNEDASSAPVAVTGCSGVEHQPRPEAFLMIKRASAGSGYTFRLRPDLEGVTQPVKRSPSPSRRLVLSLPPGTTVNTSVGAGLGVCSPAQFAAETAFSVPGQGCPGASKLGEFKATTPLFEGEGFSGSVYLAQPDEPGTSTPGAENPFDSLLALYLVTKLPRRGVQVKVAGQVHANPVNGDLTAVFDDLPLLPYTDLELTLRPGQRAFLVSPPRCGSVFSGAQLSSWSSGAVVSASIPSEVSVGFDDGPCPQGGPPFNPTAVTGGVNAQVGAYTPYFVRLSRQDNEQEITSYSLVMPKGITGKLAGIPFCPDAVIEAARGKRGFAEIASPSCPEASRVGSVNTGYGVGQSLSYAPGRIYLAGPYKGQPLSLVTINAAVIGPFDLGTYVIRSAFSVDPKTAQLRIEAGSSDPIPHISDGIPLHLRDIRVYMDRNQFTRNPSSCLASQMTSTLTGSGTNFEDPRDDSSATVTRHFQLFNCLNLDFQPKLGLRLRGGSKRGAYPSLRASFAARGPQDSNLKRIGVTTPHALFLAQEHIRTVCTRPQFQAETCPAGSVYGQAVAQTPLFDEPLRGNVYLRSSTNKLPDLVASLRSGEVRIVVEGRIGPGRKGGIETFFDELPDAPINSFTMTLYGGKRGLLVNSVDICKQPPIASVEALGQNNIGAIFSSTLRGQCSPNKGKAKGKKGGRGEGR